MRFGLLDGAGLDEEEKMDEEALVGCTSVDVVRCAIKASLSSRRRIWPANATGPLPDSVIMLASIN